MKFTTEDVVKDFNLNEKQWNTLKQFRENVSDVLKEKHDDYYLARFLRARNFDLKKSEDMIRQSMEWRKQWKADTILKDFTPPEVLKKYYPGGLAGYDKEGCPIWFAQGAKFDLKGITMSVQKETLFKFFIYLMEYIVDLCDQQTEKLGRKIYQMTVINDLTGYTLAVAFQPGMEEMMKFFPMVEANYPEFMKVNFIINAPKIFPMVYNLFKHIMHENTRKKMQVYGKEFIEPLLELVEADNIPQYIGGTLVDENGDPRCTALIPPGGTVPETYYLKPEDIIGDAKATTSVVSKGGKLDIPFTVEKGDMKMMKWVFWTLDYDIKYTVFYQESADKLYCQTIKDLERINAQTIPISGYLKCTKPGLYTFRFDNTYSWARGKEVNYLINTIDINANRDDDMMRMKTTDEATNEDLEFGVELGKEVD